MIKKYIKKIIVTIFALSITFLGSQKNLYTQNAGIANVGSSCYMNSALQALTPIYTECLAQSNININQDDKLQHSFFGLMHKLTTSNQSVINAQDTDLQKFFGAQRVFFNRRGQQCAAELLRNLVNKNNISELYNNTAFVDQAIRKEEHTLLSLPIINEDNKSLKYHLHSYFHSRKIIPETLPNFFIVELKKYNNNVQKRNTIVQIPQMLDMEDYCTRYVQKKMYNLVSVIVHSGNVNGGHYRSYVKNKFNQWILYNDQRKSQASINTILQNNATPYVLVYKKKGDIHYNPKHTDLIEKLMEKDDLQRAIEKSKKETKERNREEEEQVQLALAMSMSPSYEEQDLEYLAILEESKILEESRMAKERRQEEERIQRAMELSRQQQSTVLTPEQQFMMNIPQLKWRN